jgi:hypothetical protein
MDNDKTTEVGKPKAYTPLEIPLPQGEEINPHVDILHTQHEGYQLYKRRLKSNWLMKEPGTGRDMKVEELSSLPDGDQLFFHWAQNIMKVQEAIEADMETMFGKVDYSFVYSDKAKNNFNAALAMLKDDEDKYYKEMNAFNYLHALACKRFWELKSNKDKPLSVDILVKLVLDDEAYIKNMGSAEERAEMPAFFDKLKSHLRGLIPQEDAAQKMLESPMSLEEAKKIVRADYQTLAKEYADDPNREKKIKHALYKKYHPDLLKYNPHATVLGQAVSAIV